MKKTSIFIEMTASIRRPPHPGQSHHPGGKRIHPVAPRSGRRIVVDRLLPPENAVRLGITGVPGVGKSTFIESFGMMLVEKDMKVAVLAVDPSPAPAAAAASWPTRPAWSAYPLHQGLHPAVARPGGTLGGVGPHDPRDAAALRGRRLRCGDRGNGGGGQSETTVASMVDFFLVLMLAGAGDDLQGIKKGVLELADAWRSTRPTATTVPKKPQGPAILEMALHLLNPATPTWTPPVLTCSALEWPGSRHHLGKRFSITVKSCRATGELAAKRRDQALAVDVVPDPGRSSRSLSPACRGQGAAPVGRMMSGAGRWCPTVGSPAAPFFA
jgi:LAO/AO transport system kinase